MGSLLQGLGVTEAPLSYTANKAITGGELPCRDVTYAAYTSYVHIYIHIYVYV